MFLFNLQTFANVFIFALENKYEKMLLLHLTGKVIIFATKQKNMTRKTLLLSFLQLQWLVEKTSNMRRQSIFNSVCKLLYYEINQNCAVKG